jgi:signal transduction histidine kinase
MRTQSCFLDLVEPETGKLLPMVATGALLESLQNPAFEGEGVAGIVWKTAKPLLIEDYDHWSMRNQNISFGKLSSVIGVPLITKDKVVGVLGLAYDSTSRQTFTHEDVDFLTQFARLAAIAIENARLFQIAQAELVERKRAEAEVSNLNATLEQRVSERTIQLTSSNKELEAFAYSVSHDLRAPLRGIDGWSLALLEDNREQLDEQGRIYLDRVRSETQRMGQLIDDILKLSRMTRSEMQPTAVGLSGMVQEISKHLQERNPQQLIEFCIQPGLTAYCDQRLLEIVLMNLMDNACKFSARRPQSRVEFGAVQVNDRQTFFVRDNGVGFDMVYSKNLFGAFQRLHSQSEYPGTGIGLATVQRIIGRHGGKIWADSQVEQGATFYFTLEENA